MTLSSESGVLFPWRVIPGRRATDACCSQVHTALRRHALVLEEGPRPQPLGRVPRVARLLALAHHFERLLAEGLVRTQGELAALAGVTRPRVTQILNLLLLASDIQEELLFLPPAEHGPEIITERTLWR